MIPFCTTGNNGTGDGEYVFDRQQERLVNRTLWFRDVKSGSQPVSMIFASPLCVAFQRFRKLAEPRTIG